MIRRACGRKFLGPDEVSEVDTGACNYPTVVQETLADLAPGAARAAHRLARDLGEHRELEARAGRSGEQRCGGDADPLRPLLAVECGWILGIARETESPGRRIHRAIERAA